MEVKLTQPKQMHQNGLRLLGTNPTNFAIELVKFAKSYDLTLSQGEKPEMFLARTYNVADNKQKLALAGAFSIESTFELLDCKLLAGRNPDCYGQIMNLIENGINDLCEDFGVSFSGNIERTVVRLFESFGGLTPLDWILFFDKSANGKFKTEFETVSKNGITPEYLQNWLNKYSDLKEDVNLSRQFEPDVVRVEGEQMPQELKERIKQIKILEQKAAELRGSQKVVEGLHFFLNWMVLFQFQILYQKKTFQQLQSIAKHWLKKLTKVWELDYQQIIDSKDDEFILVSKADKDLEKYQNVQAKIIIRKLYDPTKPQEYLYRRMLAFAYQEKKSFPEMEKICFGIATGAKRDLMYGLLKLATQKVREIDKGYYNYLKSTLEADQVPFVHKDWLMIQVRRFIQRNFKNDNCNIFLDHIKELINQK